jgi:hypothetical protein
MTIRFCIGLVIGVVAGLLFSAAGWTQPPQQEEVRASALPGQVNDHSTTRQPGR